MVSEKDPVSIVSKKNKKKNEKKKIGKKVALITSTVFVTIYGCYVFNATRIKNTYDNMKISFTSVKEIEYGTANYNPLNLIKKIKDGKILSYTRKVDTSKVGEQELVFEVTKDDVVKKFKVKVAVTDTQAPNIIFNNGEVQITEGDDFDIRSNIASVNDVVDGDIPFSDVICEGKAYYTVETDLNKDVPGDYTVSVKAYDQNSNYSENSYKITVNKKPVVKIETPVQNVNYYNGPASVDTSSVLSAAYSLLGTRYTSGGVSPATGFDCSGFVHYVYAVTTGQTLSRSAGGQLGNGAPVSINDIQPGDIVIWANDGYNSASHSSIYVGDNSIIHATSNRGVQVTNMSAWDNWGQHIIGIRRV
ncbi:MAG: C40 family peptidase [Bacilli bacterium]|nr:C40 family peptidase [Bacilli bacterium]